MGSRAATVQDADSLALEGAALQHRPWRSFAGLSSGLRAVERFLAQAGFDRGPWLAVGFAAGIAAWFALDNRWQWLTLLAACTGIACVALSLISSTGRYPYLRQVLAVMPAMVAAGCLTVWAKSELVGVTAIARPTVVTLTGSILSREDRPAEDRVRLLVATREPGSGRAMKIRLNVGLAVDSPMLRKGARIRARARLMPPAAPMLPGGYDFARVAWFNGLSATGSVLGNVELLAPGDEQSGLASLKAALSRHVRERIDGTGGAIAAALVTGDRGAIAKPDDQAMRDAGLAHLLSISGLHVSAVVGAVYLISLRLLALWPWLTLRVRLPLLAAGAGAAAGIGYTLLTGAEVPTVRSCIGAVLVLLALALGREPLSLRMLAIAALFVMTLWPEAVIGPSFQMSFSAVMAIVALHGCEPARRFLAPREEGVIARGARQVVTLLATGIVIELALMPIGLFHFHRAGIYGALANVLAIPLTTLATMPLLALALLLDLVGAGAPAWWLADKSLDLLLFLAHWTATRPGAVTVFPAMGHGSIALFVAGGLWLALWRGKIRLLGLAPLLAGTLSLALLQPPDLLISGDGRHVGLVGDDGLLHVLRGKTDSFANENLAEIAGAEGEAQPLSDWPGANCNPDFCVLAVVRGGREWRLLIARGRDNVPERSLSAACERVDLVIADRWLPRSCRPSGIKVDRRLLEQSGGLAIRFSPWGVRSVAQSQGDHGWWRKPEESAAASRPPPMPDRAAGAETRSAAPQL